MAYKKLTETGENFIKEIAKRLTSTQGSTSMIKGKNSYNLPFSDKSNEVITWVCNIPNVTTNAQFALYLINEFNNNAAIYGLDANIIAAQAFQESGYKAWNYAKTSTASGISQFIMLTVYDVIYNRRFITGDDKAKLISGMEQPELDTSWIGVVGKGKYTAADRERQYRNRAILHQNICNNPDVMIKAQCALMNWIAGRNKDLASSTLFAYNRGSGLKGDNYIQIVNYTAKRFGNDYIKEGCNYVTSIFGYLGDKNNTNVPQGSITKGIWFGYEVDYANDDFNANLA